MDPFHIVAERDKGICVYCGDPGKVIDHLIPSRLGGPTTRWNLVQACRACDTRKKGHIPPIMLERALRHLAETGESLEWFYVYAFERITSFPIAQQARQVMTLLEVVEPEFAHP